MLHYRLRTLDVSGRAMNSSFMNHFSTKTSLATVVKEVKNSDTSYSLRLGGTAIELRGLVTIHLDLKRMELLPLNEESWSSSVALAVVGEII